MKERKISVKQNIRGNMFFADWRRLFWTIDDLCKLSGSSCGTILWCHLVSNLFDLQIVNIENYKLKILNLQ